MAAASPLAAQQLDGSGKVMPDPELTDPSSGLTRSIATRLGYFDQKDSIDGNPFLDESLTVIEPVVILDWDLSKDLGYTLKAAYDNVSSASIDRLHNYPDQSGASGDYWYGLEFGMRHRLDDEWRVGWHLGASVEYDYRSLKAGGETTWTPTDGRDARVTTSLDMFLDDLDVIRFNGVDEGSDQRFSVASTTQWYQILSPRMHALLGATLAYQNGFLETAYNGVVVEDGATPPFPFDNGALGTEITEELPDSRTRLALFGRLRRQLVEGTALELGARFYGDDWGISSVTLEPRLYQILLHDRLMMRLRYRYYTQSAADDYVESLPNAPLPEFRTSDSELGEYDAHSVGLKFLWFRKGEWEFDIGGDYMLREDGLDTMLASIGWKTYL
ncbi:MAG TPA: DUF3570 domain-containing protein [Planctomycetota bacterium]|nr:DUF3570 domain-containing protein [Planctomycetota bacterium]